MATDLHDLSIAELSRLIAARTLSPVELTDALIRRVEQYDAQTRAFITPTFDLARRQARQAEAEIAAGRSRGPLHGIPFGLKDIYDTAGILTSAHSRVFRDRVPSRDATATAKLYEAGAVLPPSRPASCRWRSARTPAAPSAAPRRTAGRSASCPPSAW
jgi:aspartyl-tRNA(Asn)/glutamyl-tRNA(Gln) amidotransferase subunit A